MLLNGFVKFSRVFLPNQTKLKFDQDFEACSRICWCCSSEQTMCVENDKFAVYGFGLNIHGSF